MVDKSSVVNPKYAVGQKVIIRPVEEKPLSQRENDIDSYAGQIGEVADYYWVSPRTGKVFYIYTVKAGKGFKELVLHEDEMEPCIT